MGIKKGENYVFLHAFHTDENDKDTQVAFGVYFLQLMFTLCLFYLWDTSLRNADLIIFQLNKLLQVWHNQDAGKKKKKRIPIVSQL